MVLRLYFTFNWLPSSGWLCTDLAGSHPVVLTTARLTLLHPAPFASPLPFPPRQEGHLAGAVEISAV